MKHSNIIALLLIVIAGIVAYKIYEEFTPPAPPNVKVNDDTFDKLQMGMTKAQVATLLGEPHRTTHGRIVAAETRYSRDIHFALDEWQNVPEELQIYQGQNDERLLVLFSKQGMVVAVEYAIGESPVLYKGQGGGESQPATGLAPRTCSNETEAAAASRFYQRLEQKRIASQPPPPPVQPPPPETPPPTPPPTETPQEAAERAAAALRFNIVLPSGSGFDDTMMAVPDNWQAANLPHQTNVYVMSYPDGGVHGIFAAKEGKCHGASASLYPGGELCTLAYYKMGQLSGPLRLWATDRARLLYAEHVNGQRHGLLGFFVDNMPCLVQKWKYGKVEAEYLIKRKDQESVAIPREEIQQQSEDGRRFVAYQERLKELLAEVEDNERKLKKNIAGWYRKESERIRRERAAQQSAAKREAMESRIESRNAAKSSAWELQLQRALYGRP